MSFGTLNKFLSLGRRVNPVKQMLSLPVQRRISISAVKLMDNEEFVEPEESFKYKKRQESDMFQQVKQNRFDKESDKIYLNQVKVLGHLSQKPRELFRDGQVFGYVFQLMTKFNNRKSMYSQITYHEILCFRPSMFDLAKKLKGNELMMFMGRLAPRKTQALADDAQYANNIIMSNFFVKVDSLVEDEEGPEDDLDF